MTDNKNTFRHISILKRMSMPLSELEIYYRQRRQYRMKCRKKLRNIRFGEVFYPLFSLFLKIDRCFRKQTIRILGDPGKHAGQVIFACTHIGGEDLERVYEALGRGCWWFVGDPCLLYKNLSGLLLHMSGSIFLDTLDREDRHIAYLRAVEVLKGGGSLMILRTKWNSG